MSVRRSYWGPLAGRLDVAATAASLLWLAITGIPPAAAAPGASWPRDPYPESKRVRQARALAEASSGTVAFAVLDSDGGLRGYDLDNAFSSASASKSLLLAAELRRLEEQGEPLDEGTRSLLEPMITYSDNDAASAIYARVGDAGMTEVAQRAGMRSFSVDPGYWGGAQVTAGDLARFYSGLDRNLAGPHHDYAKRLLADITSTQRWGIPSAVGPEWTVYFKGGWRPAGTEGTTGAVTHQAGLLEHRSGRRVAIAVLTDLSPGTTSYGVLEGITRRLLAEPPSAARWPAN